MTKPTTQCPFCGATRGLRVKIMPEEYVTCADEVGFNTVYYVQCLCGARGPDASEGEWGGEAREYSIIHWDSREVHDD